MSRNLLLKIRREKKFIARCLEEIKEEEELKRKIILVLLNYN